jgi:hypothetical protein
MDQQGKPRSTLLPRLGMYACAFGVFTCGWLAMKTEDWRMILGLTLLAGVAGLAAQAFARRSR